MGAIVILLVLSVPAYLRCGGELTGRQLVLGGLLSLLILFPHELLHALCFREDVYLYTNLKHGMLFVVGPETMSRARFIAMSLLPNVVFGAIPYAVGMSFPRYAFLVVLGTMATAMGFGDYYNVFHAATQMPRGARTYLYRFNSFWYLPE